MEGVRAVGDEITLGGADGRKAAVVLRLRAGDEIEIVDSSGSAFEAVVVRQAPFAVRLRGELARPPAPPFALTLAQGVPKGAKMDFVVEKATELGVARILPLRTERAAAGAEGKVRRWRRLARSAAQQCGRRDVPDVGEPIDWNALCALLPSFELALLPWENAEPVALRERLGGLLEGVGSVLVIIGPEGGLGHDEVERAVAAGATTISLGRRILRTETAGLVTCSIIWYACGAL